jgi:hypothetical protein
MYRVYCIDKMPNLFSPIYSWFFFGGGIFVLLKFKWHCNLQI